MKQEIIRKLSAAVAMSLVVGVSLAACGGGSQSPPARGGAKTASQPFPRKGDAASVKRQSR